MIVRFDQLDRYETPILTLCNPGSFYDPSTNIITNTIGEITDHEAEEIVYNFNSPCELSFRVRRIIREDQEDNEYAFKIYKSLQNKRLIFVEDIGYFVIKSVDDNLDDEGRYKDISAESLESEIQQKMVPFLQDGVYKFYNEPSSVSSNESGDESEKRHLASDTPILNTIVSQLPLWSIGEVAQTVADKYRTFEDVSTSENCLNFLLNEAQEAYECIILFDIKKREINVYDQNNYVRKTNIHITHDDFINSLSISEGSEDIYTAINTSENDGVYISILNPLGSNVIYNFDFYKSWMTSNLRSAVTQWQSDINDMESVYYRLNEIYYTKNAKLSNYELENEKLKLQIELYQKIKTNIITEYTSNKMNVPDDDISQEQSVIIANNIISLLHKMNNILSEQDMALIPTTESSDISNIAEYIAYVLSEINNKIETCESNIDTNNNHISNINNRKPSELDIPKTDGESCHNFSEIESEIEGFSLEYIDYLTGLIRDDLNINNYFTNEEIGELNYYIFEGTYRDDYVKITDIMTYDEIFEQAKILYDRAKLRLSKVSSPSQEFKIDVDNFVFNKEFSNWTEQIETGCLINVELDTDDIAELFLSNITINYEDHDLSMTFGNRFNKYDTKSLFENMLGKISKSSNTLNFVKDILYPVKNGEIDSAKQAIANARNISMTSALSSTNEEVIIDDSGYLGRTVNDNGVVDPRQIKIVGRNIVFTDDNWETCKTAIGEISLNNDFDNRFYGINAEAIIGDMIVGRNIKIINESGDPILTTTSNELAITISGTANNIVDDKLSSVNSSISNLNNAYNNISDKISEGATNVKTSMGYEFNNNGLSISRDGANVKNKINHTGMYVTTSSNDEVLTANESGVTASNLHSKQYLIIGDHCRFENYLENRIGCFYIGR